MKEIDGRVWCDSFLGKNLGTIIYVWISTHKCACVYMGRVCREQICASPLCPRQLVLCQDLSTGNTGGTKLKATLTRMPTSPGSPGSPGSPCTQNTARGHNPAGHGPRHKGPKPPGHPFLELKLIQKNVTAGDQRPSLPQRPFYRSRADLHWEWYCLNLTRSCHWRSTKQNSDRIAEKAQGLE